MDTRIYQVSTLQALSMGYTRSVVNVGEVITSLFGQYTREIERKALRQVITNRMGEGIPVLFRTDSDKLMLILSNLLCNAINFNRKEKRVEKHH